MISEILHEDGDAIFAKSDIAFASCFVVVCRSVVKPRVGTRLADSLLDTYAMTHSAPPLFTHRR